MSDSVTTTTANLPGRKVLKVIGDVTGPLGLLCFGAALWHYNASENIFSFAAWGVLDLLTGIAMLGTANGRKAAVLPIAYGIICAFVVAMIWRSGKWDWTMVETISLIGTLVGIICWRVFGSVWGVIAFGAALTIASVPILLSTYQNPQTWEWWLWVGSGVSASAGLLLAMPMRLKNIEEWLFAGVSEVVTTIMLVLLLWPLFK